MVQIPPFYPLPSPLDKTTKHLTRLTKDISQVSANPLRPQGSSPQNIPAKASYSRVKGRGDKNWILRFAQNDGATSRMDIASQSIYQ